MMTTFSRGLAAASALALLSSCGTPGMMASTSRRVDDARSKAAEAREQFAAPVFRILEEEPGPWVTTGSTPRGEDTPPPKILKQEARFVSAELISLPDIVESVAHTHNISIILRNDVFQRKEKPGARRHSVEAGQPGPSYGDVATADVQLSALGEIPRLSLNYSGTLGGLMDTIANRTGLHWRYVDGSIVFSRLQTRTFQLRTMPGKSSFSATVGKTADASTLSDRSARLAYGANSSISMSSSMDYWEELLATVSGMLSHDGRVTTSAMTNSITVTDVPEAIDRIAQFVAAENAVLGRQVSLRVQVYSIKLSEESASGIDWKLVYRLDGTNPASMSGPGGLAISDRAQAGRIGVSVANGRFADSKFMIQALSAQGRVATVIDTNVVTLNNQPAPVAVTENRGYISKTTLTPGTLGSPPLLTMEQDVLTTGFIMNLLPTIMENRSIMLQVQVDLSELKRMDRFSGNTGQAGSGDAADDTPSASLESPYTSTIQTMQRASLKSGETLILSGFRRSDNKAERNGVFNYQGGDQIARQDDEEIVLLISPELVEGV